MRPWRSRCPAQLDTDHPTLAALPARESLAAAWLAGYRTSRTRRADALDLSTWLELPRHAPDAPGHEGLSSSAPAPGPG